MKKQPENTFFCEVYHCKMPKATCIVRQERAREIDTPDPHCRNCAAGRKLKRDHRRHHHKKIKNALRKMDRMANTADLPDPVREKLDATTRIIRDSLESMAVQPERMHERMKAAARRGLCGHRDISRYNGGKFHEMPGR